jgi:hypothetical protein
MDEQERINEAEGSDFEQEAETSAELASRSAPPRVIRKAPRRPAPT